MHRTTANVGIGTLAPSQKLHVIGNIQASGTITPSDARFKNNIQPITNPIGKLLQLKGVTYTYNTMDFPDRGFDSVQQLGVIAQDVEKIFPQLVFTDDKGYKAVDYPKLIPVLIEAVKESYADIEKNKKQNDTRDKTLAEIKAENNKLKARMDKLEELLLNKK